MSIRPRYARNIEIFPTHLKFWLVVFLAAIFVLPLSAANEPAPLQPAMDKSKVQDLLRSLSFFEHNEGQDRVLFLTQGLGYAAYLTREGATLELLGRLLGRLWSLTELFPSTFADRV